MEYPTLDNLIVLNTLGEGGFSKVKLVQDEHKHQFAAKIFKFSSESLNVREEDSLLNEVNNLQRIHHPNVLSFIKFKENGRYTKRGQERQVTYILMELCENGSLFDYIFNNGFMEERICRFYFRQVVEAVEACHRAGVCHRDIKPENILFDGNYDLKLADLGFSISTRGRTGDGLLGSEVGTGGYMAPEIYLGRVYKGEQVDIFSLGVVLFVMRAYNPPFIKATLNDSYYRLFVNEEPRFWAICSKNKEASHFSEDFKTLIRGLFAYDPDNRFTLEEIKASAWYNGPFIGPLSLLHADNEERKIPSVCISDISAVSSSAEFSIKSYRDEFKIKTSSLFNDDFLIKSIGQDEFKKLRYSKIVTGLEPSCIVRAFRIFFEEIKGSYSPITSELKIRVSVEELAMEFKIRFYRREGSIVIYLQKVKGDEFGFIGVLKKLEGIVRQREELIREE